MADIVALREKLLLALAKPLPDDGQVHSNVFDPWSDVIEGIYGSYASESDEIMIAAMKAVRDRTTFTFVQERGFIAEFVLYVLAGHGLTDYGTSPRGAWVEHGIQDLWQPLIDKWESYYNIVWAE